MKELSLQGKERLSGHPKEVLNEILWILETGAQWSELSSAT